jgi:hypothetical protein
MQADVRYGSIESILADPRNAGFAPIATKQRTSLEVS